MQATTYVQLNEHGSAVVAGTSIHVDAIGYAHRDGTPEDDLLAWFSIDRVQLYGALAYFYEHQAQLHAETTAKVQDAIERGEVTTNILDRLRGMRRA